MKSFLIATVCIGLAHCGYHYPVPQQLPSYRPSNYYDSSSSNNFNYYQNSGGTQYKNPNYSAQESSSTFTSHNNQQYNQNGAALHHYTNNPYNNGHEISNSANYNNQFNYNPGEVQVQKHVYVHVAPPDEEYHQQQQQQQLAAQARKHYKIIFIKAPTYQSQATRLLQQQQQQLEEKTIVYVLTKKPDDVADLVQQQINTIKPSKPEVYFIRYKSRKSNNNNDAALNTSGSTAPGTVANIEGSSSQNIADSQLDSYANSGVVSNVESLPAKYGPPAQ